MKLDKLHVGDARARPPRHRETAPDPQRGGDRAEPEHHRDVPRPFVAEEDGEGEGAQPDRAKDLIERP